MFSRTDTVQSVGFCARPPLVSDVFARRRIMKVTRSELAKMSRKERNRTIAELARAATAHRDNRSLLQVFLDAVRNFFVPGRVPR